MRISVRKQSRRSSRSQRTGALALPAASVVLWRRRLGLRVLCFFFLLLLGWFTCQNNCGRSFVQFQDSMANMRDWLGSIGIRMETTLLRMGTSFVCTICVATIMTAQLTRTADRPGNRARRTVSYPSRRRVNEINQFVRRRQCMRAQALLRSSPYARVTRVCVCNGRVRASACPGNHKNEK